jgi:LacI family transcriptional regulator
MKAQVLLIFSTRFEECTHILKGIAQYERSHGPWAAFLDDEMRAESDSRWLSSKKWSGVISRHTTPKLVQACHARKIPLVDLNDTAPFPGVPKIRPDNVALGHMGSEHLLERGFTNLAFCGFRNNAWSCERRDGFIEAAKLAGHRVEVLDVDYPGDLTPFWDDEQAEELCVWIKSLPKPVGIMACNDMRALQLLTAASMAKLLVPEEVAILGVNNDAIRCDLAYPSLSSVAPNPFQSGYLAAELMSRLIAGQPIEQMDVRIDPLGVVTRQSTDLLAIQDRSMASALAYIREHACSGITVDQVIHHASASRSLLEKKFRQHLGRSPHAEIRRVQVGKIKQLLVETDFPLKKIAELTGFEHVEYMCVLFKRTTGNSPGEYRKQHQSLSNQPPGR